jgi:hypothetical protein
MSKTTEYINYLIARGNELHKEHNAPKLIGKIKILSSLIDRKYSEYDPFGEEDWDDDKEDKELIEKAEKIASEIEIIVQEKLNKKPPNIITLCGSTKFKTLFLEVAKWLTLQGNIVISVGLFGQADGDKITIEEKQMLDELHKDKIDLCNEIFVINPSDYIGESTKKEIEYAEETGKNIRYYTKEEEEINKWKLEYYSRTNTENWNMATVINL